jgi:diaminohydroxyphosphoribosylaminopyrimidine deaminase/5-amino-6-(5-phosphoribosylamino)uracil reductase
VFSGVAGGPAHAALGAAGARLEHVQANPRCDLAAVLERLAALECNDVLVEAGPAVSGAFLEAGLIDELVLYLAPHLLGSQARPLVETLPLTRLADRHSLVLEDVRRLGDDLRVIARPATVAAPPTR